MWTKDFPRQSTKTKLDDYFKATEGSYLVFFYLFTFLDLEKVLRNSKRF